MADAEELEDLESGLSSAFWRRLKAQWESEWGPKGEIYLQAVNAAINNLDDEMQRRNLECVRFAQIEISRLMQWPQQRLDVLNGKDDDAPMSLKEKMLALRRQDQQMAGIGRRGQL